MKKLILITLMISAFGQLLGQSITMPDHVLKQRGRFLKQLLPDCKNIHSLPGAAKTTDAIAERLIALNGYNYSVLDTFYYPLGITDSASFNYSGSRSSTFNYNTMVYDNTYAIYGGHIFGFYSGVGFYDHNDKPSILCDTTLIWSSNKAYGIPFGFSNTRYALYDTSDNVIEYADLYLMDSTTSYTDNRYINSYSSGDISHSMALSWNMGLWDTSELRSFVYSTGRVVTDSTNMYIMAGYTTPFEKWIYTYNSYGDMTNASYYIYDGFTPWQETERYKMVYYTDHTLKTDSISLLLGSTWGAVTKDSFGYSSGVPYVTYSKQYSYYYDTLKSYDIFTKHSVSGLPDTLFASKYNAVGNWLMQKSKVTFSYDSYNEPTVATQYNYNITDSSTGAGSYNATADYVNHYYYETYLKHSNGIPTITPQNTTNIIVFPNPTTGDIQVSQPGLKAGTHVGIQVMNAAGQVVRSESMPWLHETETISLAGLTPGTYLLVIHNGNTQVYSRQVVKL